VLFTANDAYMRDFDLYIPSDCVASNTDEENRYALHQMQKILKADITPSDELDLVKLAESIRSRTPKHLHTDSHSFNRYRDADRRAG
jgi:isochorismate hydrolase